MCTLDLAQKFLDSTGIRKDVLASNNEIIRELSLNYSLMRALHRSCGINLDKLDALKIFMENASTVNDDIELVMAELVSRTYSNDEVRAIIDFQESPAGKHYEKTLPQMMEKLAEEFRALLWVINDKVNSEIKEKLEDELKKSRVFMNEFVREVRMDPDESQRLIF